MPKSENMVMLQKALVSAFPADLRDEKVFDFYPVCNEHGFEKIIKDLSKIQLTVKEGRIRVAILFGESNFLSMLPLLTKFADVILLADLEPLLHKHNEYMLRIFTKSNSPSEFFSSYIAENSFPPQWAPKDEYTFLLAEDTENMFGKSSIPAQSLQEHHFLYSQERYSICKQAAEAVPIIQINFNLLNMDACFLMASLLYAHNANLTFCNFTNIKHYQHPKMQRLHQTVPVLLQECNDAIIMFSNLSSAERLESTFSLDLDSYFAQSLKMEKTRPQLTIKKNGIEYVEESSSTPPLKQSQLLSTEGIFCTNMQGNTSPTIRADLDVSNLETVSSL